MLSTALILCCLFALVRSFQPPVEWRTTGIIDHHIAQHLLTLRNSIFESEKTLLIRTTIDLGKTESDLVLGAEGISANSNLLATWEELIEISDKKGCWAVYEDGSKPWKVSALSKNTNNPASLCPPLSSTGAPTLILGGFTMHRIVGDDMNPTLDTAAKIASVSSSLYPGACVLDTCCGLGYTAIEAARKIGVNGKVVTVELDDASLEMCAYNPWSQQLFDGSLPIEIVQGDSCELAKSFPSSFFQAIIHDPPARALCRKGLYSLEFYKELRRVLKPSGTLFHYIGRSDSKESGRLYRGIQERLLEAGFASVKKRSSAFGVVATGFRESSFKGVVNTARVIRRRSTAQDESSLEDF